MNKRVFLATLLIASLLSVSCMKTGKEKATQLVQHEKAPKNLVSVMEGIDWILNSIKEMEKTLKLSPSEYEIQHSDDKIGKDDAEEDKDSSKDQGSEENKGEEKKDKEEGKGDKENKQKPVESKDEEVIKTWKAIDDRIERIHRDWNNYEAADIKKGANPKKGEELKQGLNLLTKTIENRDIASIMDSGSKALLSLSYYFDLYRDEVYGDLAKIRYIAYQSYLNARGKNFKSADRLLESGEEHIASLRQKLGKEGNKDTMKSLDRLSLSIDDMKQSLKDSSIRLLEIKRDIILDNIKGLQK